MKKSEKKILDEILKSIEKFTEILLEDIVEEIPQEAIQNFRITDEVFNEMEKRLGKNWMDGIGIT